VIGLNPVVGALLSAMPGRRQQLLQQNQVGRCPVGDNLDRLVLVVPMARWKNRRAAVISRYGETKTSMTWPN
jgi:hypothetical protein